MMTLETRTISSQSQTPTGQKAHGMRLAELWDPQVLGIDDRFNPLADPELMQHLLESLHRRLVSAIAGFDFFEPKLAGIQVIGTSGAGRNARRESLKRELYSLLGEAGKENWDGEGALALSEVTVAIAMDLVDRLPLYTTKPEVAATPHGEVDFDWVIDRETMLTVSVCPSKEIAFAGLFHGARLNGSEPWSGFLPHFVNCCLERLRDAQTS